MKKTELIAILFGAIFLSSCIDRCRVLEYYPPNEIAETYCRNMIPGNYWIYTNQDSTRTDSLYFTYVPGEIQGKYIVKNICAGWYRRIMNLHSTFLTAGQAGARYYSGGIDETSLSFGDNERGFSLFFFSDKEKCQTSLIKGIEKMNFINDVRIGSTVYQEVINVDDRFLIAPGVGLIQYVSYNNIDTFYIEKYYMK